MTLAFPAGVSVVIQQVLNAQPARCAQLGRLVGAHELLPRGRVHGDARRCHARPYPVPTVAGRIRWWARSGGLFGAALIALAIFLVPKIGIATFIAPLITGQMFISVAFDNFGWLGLAPRPVDLPRLIGAVLFIARVILIWR
jgi:transporter family-2 protein